MSQPPGPYGDAYGQPEGQPPPYGPSQPYPSPGPYGPPGPYGAPAQPPQKNLLPWLIVGGAVLLSAIGILLVVLFTGNGSTPVDETATRVSSTAPAPSSSASPSRQPALGDLPGGAQLAEPTLTAGNAFPGSDGVALAWIEGMAHGDFQAAYDLSCAEVQDAATTAAAGGDPAYELARYFFEQTLGGVGFTEGTFDSIQYDDTTGTDIAAFTLALDNGESFTLLLYVGEDLTVCDFL
jgi:hypothetical protein